MPWGHEVRQELSSEETEIIVDAVCNKYCVCFSRYKKARFEKEAFAGRNARDSPSCSFDSCSLPVTHSCTTTSWGWVQFAC